MSVMIDSVRIDGDYITMFTAYLGPELILQGRALESDGLEIHNGLKEYKEGNIVQIRDQLENKHSGVWKIEKIELSKKGTAPTIYGFSLVLSVP